MLSVIHTLDYEIHGNGDGCPQALMVEPTSRLLDLFDKFGAKLTIMADVAEILKFREFRDQFGSDDFHYEAIAEQLKNAIRRGHDVQLHLHCSYFNAQFKNGSWVQDWSEYNFAGLPRERIREVVKIGKEFLESLLKPVCPSYRCVAFRAANWSVSPSENVVRSLVENGIQIETSVFKYGVRRGIVNFDYSEAYSHLLPWRASEADICKRDDASRLLEIPIYCERRPITAFVTKNRIQRALMSRRHRVQQPEATKSSTASPFNRALKAITRTHPWKADFNQCTGRQLIGAAKRAIRDLPPVEAPVPFVLIGHSKSFDTSNSQSLTPFLRFVKAHDRIQFGNISDFTPSEFVYEGNGDSD